MILATLVSGPTIKIRENAIAAALTAQHDSTVTTALILEGITDGCSPLDAGTCPANVYLSRIAAGCPCCSGNLTLRVTLNRILRKSPDQLYISVANCEHLEHLRDFLSQAPYSQYLVLTPDLAL